MRRRRGRRHWKTKKRADFEEKDACKVEAEVKI